MDARKGPRKQSARQSREQFVFFDSWLERGSGTLGDSEKKAREKGVAPPKRRAARPFNRVKGQGRYFNSGNEVRASARAEKRKMAGARLNPSLYWNLLQNIADKTQKSAVERDKGTLQIRTPDA